jgi:hypothetical protein
MSSSVFFERFSSVDERTHELECALATHPFIALACNGSLHEVREYFEACCCTKYESDRSFRPILHDYSAWQDFRVLKNSASAKHLHVVTFSPDVIDSMFTAMSGRSTPGLHHGQSSMHVINVGKLHAVVYFQDCPFFKMKEESRQGTIQDIGAVFENKHCIDHTFLCRVALEPPLIANENSFLRAEELPLLTNYNMSNSCWLFQTLLVLNKVIGKALPCLMERMNAKPDAIRELVLKLNENEKRTFMGLVRMFRLLLPWIKLFNCYDRVLTIELRELQLNLMEHPDMAQTPLDRKQNRQLDAAEMVIKIADSYIAFHDFLSRGIAGSLIQENVTDPLGRCQTCVYVTGRCCSCLKIHDNEPFLVSHFILDSTIVDTSSADATDMSLNAAVGIPDVMCRCGGNIVIRKAEIKPANLKVGSTILIHLPKKGGSPAIVMSEAEGKCHLKLRGVIIEPIHYICYHTPLDAGNFGGCGHYTGVAIRSSGSFLYDDGKVPCPVNTVPKMNTVIGVFKVKKTHGDVNFIEKIYASHEQYYWSEMQVRIRKTPDLADPIIDNARQMIKLYENPPPGVDIAILKREAYLAAHHAAMRMADCKCVRQCYLREAPDSEKHDDIKRLDDKWAATKLEMEAALVWIGPVQLPGNVYAEC